MSTLGVLAHTSEYRLDTGICRVSFWFFITCSEWQWSAGESYWKTKSRVLFTRHKSCADTTEVSWTSDKWALGAADEGNHISEGFGDIDKEMALKQVCAVVPWRVRMLALLWGRESCRNSTFLYQDTAAAQRVCEQGMSNPEVYLPSAEIQSPHVWGYWPYPIISYWGLSSVTVPSSVR